MSRFLIVVGVCGILCGLCIQSNGKEAPGKAPAAKASPADKPAEKFKVPEGFKRLFDGKTLKGWKGRPTLWKVTDGVIEGRTTATAAADDVLELFRS